MNFIKSIIKTTFFIILFFYTMNLFSEKSENFVLPKDSIKLLFGGDTHFVWGVEDLQKQKKLSPIENIIPIFERVDFRALNIETVFSESAQPLNRKTYVFNSSPNNLELLKKLKIDLAFLGNNHSFDYGEKGLSETLENFKKNNIPIIGAGINIEEATKPFLINLKEIKFAFFSISQIASSKDDFADSKKSGIAKYDENFIKKIKEIKNQVDFIFVSIHWGNEYNPKISEQQKNLAKNLMKNGVNFIIGHHPHIPQAIDIKQNSGIIYSLGNFLFGSTNYFQNNNILAIFHFSLDKKKFIGVEIIPITGINRKYQFQVSTLNKEESLKLFKEIYVLSKLENPNQKILINQKSNRLFFIAED